MGIVRRSCLGLIVSLAFIAPSVLMTVVLGQVVTLDCARPEPAEIICERSSTFAGIRLGGPRTIRDVSGAWVEENCDEGCTYRVMLTAGRGDVPLTVAYTSDERANAEIAEEINTFVAGGAATVAITIRPNPLVIGAVQILMIIGLAIAAHILFAR